MLIDNPEPTRCQRCDGVTQVAMGNDQCKRCDREENDMTTPPDSVEALAYVARTAWWDGVSNTLRAELAYGKNMVMMEAAFEAGFRAGRTPVASQAQEIAALRSALELAMVGGNHLASMLIGQLGAGFAERFPPDMDHETALRQLCATDAYDVWCCWSALMRARAALSQENG